MKTEMEIAEMAGRVCLHNFIKQEPSIYDQKYIYNRYSHHDGFFFSSFTQYFFELKGRKINHTYNKGFVIKKSKYDFLKQMSQELKDSGEYNFEMLFINVCLDAVVIHNISDFDVDDEAWFEEIQQKTNYEDKTLQKKIVTYLPLSAASHVFLHKSDLAGTFNNLKQKYIK